MAIAKNKRRLRADLSCVVINDLGGTTKVAEICRGLAKSTVSEWKRDGIPQSWLLYLRERFKDMPVMRLPEIEGF